MLAIILSLPICMCRTVSNATLAETTLVFWLVSTILFLMLGAPRHFLESLKRHLFLRSGRVKIQAQGFVDSLVDAAHHFKSVFCSTDTQPFMILGKLSLPLPTCVASACCCATIITIKLAPPPPPCCALRPRKRGIPNSGELGRFACVILKKTDRTKKVVSGRSSDTCLEACESTSAWDLKTQFLVCQTGIVQLFSNDQHLNMQSLRVRFWLRAFQSVAWQSDYHCNSFWAKLMISRIFRGSLKLMRGKMHVVLHLAVCSSLQICKLDVSCLQPCSSQASLKILQHIGLWEHLNPRSSCRFLVEGNLGLVAQILGSSRSLRRSLEETPSLIYID